MLNRTEKTAHDIAARAAATFVQAFATTLLAAGFSDHVADIAMWQRAAIAGGAAVLSLAQHLAGNYLASGHIDAA